MIDSGRNLTGGRRAAAAMTATGLPVLAILLTHPHPDHVGGLGILHEAFPRAPIYASKATANWMMTNPLGFYELARKADPDFPAKITYPDRILKPGERLEIGGIGFETADFGPGESAAATVFYEPTTRALFVGDIVSNRCTPALLEGHTCDWLGNLDLLAKRFPNAGKIYPGHGAAASAAALIGQQRAYLQRVRNLVAPAVEKGSPGSGKVNSSEQYAILNQLDHDYPNYPLVASLTTLKQVNVQAVGGELRRGSPRKCCCP